MPSSKSSASWSTRIADAATYYFFVHGTLAAWAAGLGLSIYGGFDAGLWWWAAVLVGLAVAAITFVAATFIYEWWWVPRRLISTLAVPAALAAGLWWAGWWPLAAGGTLMTYAWGVVMTIANNPPITDPSMGLTIAQAHSPRTTGRPTQERV